MLNQRQVIRLVLDNIYWFNRMTTDEVLEDILHKIKPVYVLPIPNACFQNVIGAWNIKYKYCNVNQDYEVVDGESTRHYIFHIVSLIFDIITEHQDEQQRIIARNPDGDWALCQHCCSMYDKQDAFLQRIPEHIIEEVDNLCPACVKDEWDVCEECDEWTEIGKVRRADNLLTGGVHTYCEACYNKYYGRCANCGSAELIENLIQLVHKEKEYDLCVRCEGIVHQTCECGTKFVVFNRHRQFHGEAAACDRCLYDKLPYQSHVYKPIETVFHISDKEHQRPDTFFLGLELECEVEGDYSREDFAVQLKKDYTFDDMYLVHDGSLKYGIEVVLQPFSALWYKRNKQKLAAIYERMEQLGGNFDRDRVGLHIHTSKVAWSASQIYKLIQFAYDPAHEKVLSLFYGREPAKYSRKSDSEYYGATYIAKKGKNVDNDHHYNMINLSCGNTIEFRMFAGTKEFEDLLRYIDFLLAV